MSCHRSSIAIVCMLLASSAGGAPPMKDSLEATLSSEDRSQLRRDLDAWGPELYGDRPTREQRIRRAAEVLRERFREADANGDQALDRKEFMQFAPRQARHFDAIDTNHDGRVDADEVRQAIRERIERRVERRMENGLMRR